ncbi:MULTISPECIES: nucleotidyl transferase AbiEii/AbiGii toxin family protein [unclassified Polaromonas]|uniref:nucleotidyl transferase AbiEii/AbiGii toxin family protein n=1 Tax=unclassified Polaromonas TaxID=2638319 RepID=UPI000F07C1EA|nr:MULTISPECIES: nucleotidyl transferase AbiEii/AbiGii toxin family protein [unclassified Polaromonas]AYQ28202.1 nucleotidyl transferase AbiEii/AbiGii toxin family protein [Polaromonas sp. SP1]QGJ16934.1 nucleotidyl transferase AbiEii/AbiGii toxin family protein [Polaromonas sp. Pch-P]
MSKDLAASVRARLLNKAKAEQSDFNGVLVRYALERLLYRLSQSVHADHFLLKGAMLFTLWYDMPHRPTRDVDLLGFGASDPASVTQTFKEIASVVSEDGMRFDPESVVAEEIRKEAGYAGVRVFITAELAGARVKTQIDIGFGDAVTPGPQQAVYPVMLDDFPAPTLQAYPVYTVIAEKLHAIALLGMTNSRLKDYLDLSVLLEREALDPNTLAKAIAGTFQRRGMRVPATLPVGLSDEFANDTSRQALWRAFLKKNQLNGVPLPELVAALRAGFEPALQQAVSEKGR